MQGVFIAVYGINFKEGDMPDPEQGKIMHTKARIKEDFKGFARRMYFAGQVPYGIVYRFSTVKDAQSWLNEKKLPPFADFYLGASPRGFVKWASARGTAV